MRIRRFWITISLVAFLIIGIRCPVIAEDLETVIGYLLQYVRNSEVVFIRNNKEHTAHEAEDHMRKKYQHFKEQIKTPEDFIQFAGTKSLLSGRRYRVRLKNGKTIQSQKWLEIALEEYRKKNSG